MSSSELVMFIGGVIAIVLGAVDVLRTAPSGAIALTSIGVVVLGVVFVLLAFI